MIVTIPDLHFREEEPFFSGNQRMVERLLTLFRSMKDGEDRVSFIFLGDLFHRPRETGRVNGLIQKLIRETVALGETIIIRGNHDFTKRDGNALAALYGIDGLSIIEEPVIQLIQGLPCLFLPFIYSRTTLSNGVYVESVGDYYKDGSFLDGSTEVAHVFGHVGDENAGEYGQDCDLSWLPSSIPRHLGHIHKRVAKSYPGSLSVTRRDEAGKKGFIRLITGDAYQDLEVEPTFDIFTVPYGEDPRKIVTTPFALVDISGHQDKEIPLQEYQKKYPFAETGMIFDQVLLDDTRDETISETEEDEGKSALPPLPYLMKAFIQAKGVKEGLATVLKETLHETR